MGTHHLPVTPHECLCLANQCYYCGYETVPSLARSVVVSLRPAPESLLALVACVVCEFTDEASEALYNQIYVWLQQNITSLKIPVYNIIDFCCMDTWSLTLRSN